jgi:hypothetical protein
VANGRGANSCVKMLGLNCVTPPKICQNVTFLGNTVIVGATS